jgi:cbb3-type cytochrome oxidase subunit 1
MYLGVGFTLGAIMLARPTLPSSSSVLILRPLHTEILLIGWMLQLAFGVAYWILPRFAGDQARGREWPAWTSLVILNAGLLTAGFGQTFGLGLLSSLGRSAEMVAAVLLAAHLWSRVGRPSGKSGIRNPLSGSG